MSILVRTILLFAALLSAPLAAALGLGDIAGRGAIGEHLDARVPLHLAPGERATLKSVDLLPDMFARDDATPLDTLRASLAFEDDRTYIHVTSTVPIAVEHLRFRLRLNTQRGALIARFALRALPAYRANLTTRTVPRNEPVIVPRSPAFVAASATVPAAPHTYGPVRNGESLWTIARRLVAADKVHATMQSLHAANPTAFVAGDINRLRAGVTLTVPGDITSTRKQESASATSPSRVRDDASANDVVNEREAARDIAEEEVAAGEDIDTLLNEEERAPSEVAAAAAREGAEDTTTSTRAGRAARDEALAQRLAALDAKFAAIRAKYGEETSTARTADAAMGQLPAAAAANPSAGSATRVAATRATDAPVPPAPAKPTRALPTDVAVPTRRAEETGLPAWLPVSGIAVLVLLVLLALLPRINRRLEAWRTRVSVASVKAEDAGRKAEVARKAESRVRLESEIEDLLNRKTPAPLAAASTPAIAAAVPRMEITQPPLSALEQTYDPLAITSGGALLENDREVAIDANIAHGRYAEAEALLREVIHTHPRNVQAKLRLAEVYYITEKIDGFAAVAVDIKDNHRPDLTDEEWQRVVRMGKIIAPDLTLFSGPRAVDKRA